MSLGNRVAGVTCGGLRAVPLSGTSRWPAGRSARTLTPSPNEEDVITGRSALVGGGATGIGRAVAEHLVKSGYRVVITGRRADVLEATAREIHAEALVADIADPDPPAAVGDVDVLVLNAGGPAAGRILSVTDPLWEQAFAPLGAGPLRQSSPTSGPP